MRINTKLLLAFLLISLIPFAFENAFSYLAFENINSEEVHNRLEAVASIQENRINALLDQDLERAQIISHDREIALNLANYSADPQKTYQDNMNFYLDEIVRNIDPFESVAIVNSSSSILASNNKETINQTHPFSDSFDHNLTDVLLHAFFLDENDSLMHYLVVPIYSQGIFLGAAIAVSSNDDILSLVEDYPGLGDSGESVIAKRTAEGDALFLTNLKYDDHAALNRTVKKTDTHVPITQALLGKEEFFSNYVDYRGVRVLATTRYIERADWGLVVKIDRAEAFRSFEDFRNSLILITAAILAAVIIVSILLARQITHPVVKLTEVASEISKGALHKRVKIPTSDEIGILARTFNEMSERLLDARTDLERKVEQRTAELARSNADLQQFAYVASHDLQEPLRMVSSFLELLEEEYEDKLDSNAAEYIGFAVDGAQRMQNMINDLLDYSRVGTRTKNPTPTNCDSVLKTVTTNLLVVIEEKQAKITHDPLPTVIVDEMQFIQLFQNLIANALKFHGDDLPRVHISARKGPKEWLFSVRDNGIGMDPIYFERVFVIFQRLHDRNDYPGTGIGLALCKRIVEEHGGQIWVESKPDKGSTFYFSIPMKGT
ncbi:MAG: ATP-binding protein [Candidatus Heimdallarchaeota archaeon]